MLFNHLAFLLNMQKGKGRLFAYMLVVGQIIFAILSLNQRVETLSSSIATPEQMAVILVLSSFALGIMRYSFFFFIATLCILMIGVIVLRDYSDFLSSFVKIHIFLVLMFWIFFTKYAPDIQNSLNLPVLMNIIIQIILLILFSKALELTKTKIQEYTKSHSNIEKINKAPIAFSCPHCGYVYQSIPMYCVNCKKDIEFSHQ